MQQVLTDEQIQRLAPSVFAAAPREGLSPRYAFLPTASVLTALRSEGLEVARALQSRARDEARTGVARHMLIFRLPNQPRWKGGDSQVELIVVNSHDGSGSFRLCLGVFRFVCANGLIVSTATMAALRVAHVGARTAEEVVKAAHLLAERAGEVLERVEHWSSLELRPSQRLAFARQALKLRWPEHVPVAARDVLVPRRPEDRGTDLWRTLNVVQEHLLRGKLPGRTATGRRRMTRPVQGVASSATLNAQLWDLAARTGAGLPVPVEVEAR
jgi:hypothetical protein